MVTIWLLCTRVSQVILQGDHLLQFHMARDSSDAALQYPIRYRAEDNTTFDTDIRLNRYLSQTQVSSAPPTFVLMFFSQR